MSELANGVACGLAGTWIMSSRSVGAMRLTISSPPPWPVSVRAAAALVDQIDAHHRAGRDDNAADAAAELEKLIHVLEADGILARLSS